jgi:hypothetical protein
MSPSNNNKFRQRVRQELVKLNEQQRAEFSPRQQIDALNDRLGQGVGAKKERERLIGLMVAQDKVVPIEVVEEAPEPTPVVVEAVVKRDRPARKRTRKNS